MQPSEGLEEINRAQWVRDEYNQLMLTVHDERDRKVIAYLSLRPHYCDRGHIKLLIDGDIELDGADSFPRYFFSRAEAMDHTKLFLKWRLWKHRIYSHEL